MAHHAHHYQITRQDLARAERHFKHHRSPTSHKGGKMGVAGFLGETAAVQLSALGMGVLTGRYGPLSLGPIPAELLVFLVAGGVALSGVAGHTGGNVVANVGQGVLAGYSNDFGKGLGSMWRESAAQSDPTIKPWTSSNQYWPTTSNMHPTFAGAGGRKLGAARAPLTPAELAAMAQAVR
jgi:hypothetical protein